MVWGMHSSRPTLTQMPKPRALRARSLAVKLAALVSVTTTFAVVITWVGLNNGLGPRRVLPLTIVLSVVFAQILARAITSPLREMTHAAAAMAAGDYSARVRHTGHDEVGVLAATFNAMASDLEAQTTMRRELITNVSHELRTPIAALRAQLENIVDGVTTPDNRTLQAALTQTERLGRLVADLLDLSRLESGAASLKLERLTLSDLVSDALDGAHLIAVGKEISFEVSCPPDIVVLVDEDRMHQVFANLLGNAIRHSPNGGTITITATPKKDSVVIDVADEGPGIAPADRERVFARFVRGGKGMCESGGTGLGLAIARWAVELNHGTLIVAPATKGAVFRIQLPRTIQDESRT